VIHSKKYLRKELNHKRLKKSSGLD